MREYTVVQTEVITRTYYVEAEDGDQAEEMVSDGRLTPLSVDTRESFDYDEGEEI